MKNFADIQYIFLSRTDAIGDVILTLPIAGFLKKHYPHIKIVFIGRKYTQAVIEHCEHIDYFLESTQFLSATINFPNFDPKKAAFLLVYPTKELIRRAKQIGFRYRIATSHRWYTFLYANRRISFSRKKSDLHEAQLNFKLLKGLGIDYIPSLFEIPEYYGLSSSGGTHFNLNKEKFNLILHPKSRGSAREWPLVSYYNLVQQLLAYKSSKVEIHICGTNEEKQLIQNELPEFLQITQVHYHFGKFSLAQYIKFISEADGLIACSTGPLHIASALGKHALGLYPPIEPMHPTRWAPLGIKAQYEVKDAACSDCRKSGNCHCIQSISGMKVANVLSEWLG